MEQCKPSREAEHCMYIIFRKQAYLWVGYIWLKYWDVKPLSLSSRIREMVSGVGVLPTAHKEQGRVSGNPRLSWNQKARMYHLVESSLHERISGNCFKTWGLLPHKCLSLKSLAVFLLSSRFFVNSHGMPAIRRGRHFPVLLINRLLRSTELTILPR